MKYTFLCCLLFAAIEASADNLILTPVQGQMVCSVTVPNTRNQTFALGIPETLGSSEGMILNFPDVDIVWEGPDVDGIVSHSWISPRKVEYSLRLIPHVDYVDCEMTIKNNTNTNWTDVFSFNCLNPVNAPAYQDWTLERTYMSKDGQPFRMDGTTRINTGLMKTVQFYMHEHTETISPFIGGFGALSPDKTDNSYIVTMAEDGQSYMAATSPKAVFLFDNLDRCCIHSATNFYDIPAGGQKTVTSRFYIAKGNLEDFINRYKADFRPYPYPQKPSHPGKVLMCFGNVWDLADTTQWQYVLHNLDILKIYIGNADPGRTGKENAKKLLKALFDNNIKIAIELGGLLDWHADKGNQSAEASFAQEWAELQPLITLIKEVDPTRNIGMLDFDGPIRRMLSPSNNLPTNHTLDSAIDELFEVLKMWQDSIPGIKVNLLTNFPNWAWADTPAYFAINGNSDGYGHYEEVLAAVQIKSIATGLHFDGLTIDNPYDYAMGIAQTNQANLIAGVDWMRRIRELATEAEYMNLKVNMIFNTNGARTPMEYTVQTLDFFDLYDKQIGYPDGCWIQSWYDLPYKWLPETEDYTMTNLTKRIIEKNCICPPVRTKALLEPDSGRVYHGIQLMTFESGDPIAGYLNALNDSTIQPSVRGYFFSIPGTRGPAQALRGFQGFLNAADSIGYIPELSLFLVSDVATDSIIAVSNQYDYIIDSIITMCKDYGKKMFVRIGGEFNGAGEGWNGGGYHPYIYVDMFRKIVDMYTAAGFRDSIATIWCYEPDAANDFDSTDARGYRWYPGDEYADWFGLDVFNSEHFDQSLPNTDRRGITRKGKSERFLAMARIKNKPVYMSETSAQGVNISADYDDSINDWNNWFAKFFEFIAAHPEIKGYSYINANWPEGAYPNWGDARIQNSPYVSQKYREEMHNPKYIHLRPYEVMDVKLINNSIVTLYSVSNPCNEFTNVYYSLMTSGNVSFKIYDIKGSLVAEHDAGSQTTGEHELNFKVTGLPDGVYYLVLATDTSSAIAKMVKIN